MAVAEAIMMLVEVYWWAGVVVALAFLTVGIGRIDEAARGSYLFRIMIAPGVIGLWPLILWRWMRRESGAIDA